MKRNMILAGMSKLKMMLLLLALVTLGESYALADGEVWLYKPGETEPYGTYNTIKAAVGALNNVKKDNCIIELHGDVTESSINMAPSYSVTFRSEKEADHTLKFTITNTANAFKLSATKTFTFGGGDDYGVLTIDMNGSGRAITQTYGTVNIQDGVAFINGNSTNYGGVIYLTGGNNAVLNVNGGVFRNNAADLNGGAICNSYKTTINVNGGTFENNTADSGGAIAVIVYSSSSLTNKSAKINLNGGIFSGNEAIKTSTAEIYPYGNAIYYYTNGAFNIGGTLQFGADQDIYLAEKEMVKASDITISGGNPIPVRLGTKTTDILEFRNVLSSSEDASVVSADESKFVLINDADYMKSIYLGLDFAEIDKSVDNTGQKESPVLELRTHFEDNMTNFINNDFEPVEPYKGSKTAAWLDESTKENAEIIIDEQSSELPVLIIGSLCGAHGLNATMVKSVINKTAEYYDVEYYFASQTAGGGSQFKTYEDGKPIAGKQRTWGPGNIKKGKKITAVPFPDGLYSGAHNLGGYAAKYLTERLQEQRYSKIIMMFDNAAIVSVSYEAYKPDQQIYFYQAANLLKEYYANDQVIWISSGTHVGWTDYDGTGKSGDVDPDELLIQGCYTDDSSTYHYHPTAHVTYVEGKAGTVGKFDKFNYFFVMALMDPATWLDGIKNKKVPKWEDYNLNTMGVSYKEAGDIEKYIADTFNYNNIVISDEVDPELPIAEVYVESSDDDGVTWTDISEADGVSVTRNGQKVKATIADKTYFTKKLRLRIICDCPNNFKTSDDQAKDTNIGNATIVYRTDDKARQTYELISPKLLKDILCDLIVSKGGLKSGESASFLVKNGEKVVYHVLLTGTDDETVTATITNMLPGTYTVEETSWSWSYSPADGSSKSITREISKENSNIFSFNNSKNENAPLHDEAIKVNSILTIE